MTSVRGGETAEAARDLSFRLSCRVNDPCALLSVPLAIQRQIGDETLSTYNVEKLLPDCGLGGQSE
jgi:hypothetical protein